MIKPDTEDKQYIAGLFDGEGCFSIAKQKNRRNTKWEWEYQPRAVLSIREEFVIDFLVERYGGTKGESKIEDKSKVFIWRLHGSGLLVFSKDMKEYCRVKKPHARIIYEMQSFKSKRIGKLVTKESYQKYTRWHDKLAMLNRKCIDRDNISWIENHDNPIFVGCDPGLSLPGMCVIDNDVFDVITMNGKRYLGNPNIRSWTIAKDMARHVERNYLHRDVVLSIEGPSYGSFSSSVEQLAYCRQSIFNAFKVFINSRMLECITIAPATAKKTLTGNGRADKETVITFARVMAPKTMAPHETWRDVKRRGGTVEQELNKKTAAMADAIAIATAGKRKWETNG